MILKKMFMVASIMYSGFALADDEGVVVQEDVCGTGNVIVETTEGLFVAAEYHTGMYLAEGEFVFGELKSYGFQNLKKDDGDEGQFYIKDFVHTEKEAKKELCNP